MRILFVILVVLLLAPSYDAVDPRPRWRALPTIHARPVTLDAGNPTRRRVGALTYLGGYHLTSSDPAFGGFSSLLVRGGEMLLLSDQGLWLRMRLSDGAQPVVTGHGDLPDGPGAGRIREDRDSESLAFDPATSRLWVGFEHHNAIWRYDAGFRSAERGRNPPAMARWRRSGGPEAMVRLRSGWFLVVAEYGLERGVARPGLAFEGDPTTREPAFAFRYAPPARYSPTDMAELPDGRLLVLNRSFSLKGLFTAKLTLVDREAIRSGARVAGREVGTLAAPLIHDNFEGLAISREGDATIVWLLSDDNGPSWWQRTLLLKFRLDLPDKPGSKGAYK